MAASAAAGPVMVQEMPATPVVDLPSESSATAHDSSAATANGNGSARASSPPGIDPQEWESLSLFEEILDDLEEYEYASETKDDVCTVEEARAIRKALHTTGPDAFVFNYLTCGKEKARKLLTAFGIRLPKILDGFEDDHYYKLLGHAITRELNKRQRLEEYKSIDDAADLLRNCNKIMVITGAGISTSLGIPDFRSKSTGFYSKLQEMGFSEPEQVFDIHNFDEDPSTFYTLAGDILPDLDRWTPTHQFIRLLQDKGKLLTNYTQNIDNVEAHAGIHKDKLIQCHGSWATATCRKCKHKIPGEEIFDDIRAHKPAECKVCKADIAAAAGTKKRKRRSHGSHGPHKKRKYDEDDSDSDGLYDIPEPGIMKPDITFFGEALPSDFFERLKNEDRDKVDLVIVMGTSMKVAPVSEVPNFLPSDVPQIYISRDPIHHINFDINLLGNCDDVVAELARRAGWTLEHKMLRKGQVSNVTPTTDGEGHVHVVKAVPSANGMKIEEPVKPESKLPA